MKNVFELYKKNEKKLAVTGGLSSPWFWRKDELSNKQFTLLSTIEKEKYIQFLLTIDESERGTIDEYILRFYGPVIKNENVKFLSIDEGEDLVPTVEDNVIPTETEVPDDKELVVNYLNEFFKYENPRWKKELMFDSADKFIENTQNYMKLDVLTTRYIRTYKEMK